MSRFIPPGSTIGIIGGGQLGKMMALSARAMGYRIALLDPNEHCPCAGIADAFIVANYDDEKAIERLAQKSDVLTYEFENVDVDVLRSVEEAGMLPQGIKPLWTAQHRLREKACFKKAGIPFVPYTLISEPTQLAHAVIEIGLPAVLKTISGGYDGKGQFLIESREDLERARNFVYHNGECVLEHWLMFDKEISVIMTRGQDGELALYPIPENLHEHQMLRSSLVPARIRDTVLEQANEMARKLAQSLSFVGTFALEMFVRGDEVYANEMAPRPHNTGHYTIEACSVSQFEQHIRAICGLPLLPIEMTGAAYMKNIIGDDVHDYTSREAHMNGHVHLYGKNEARPKRKMGHVTYTALSYEKLIQMIEEKEKESWYSSVGTFLGGKQ
ncbi:phosphoribosylaminoimidazole carboxylase [Pontibacillus halophilus JSM 076056 = DSM 19796]|uniref:N5-carboxyaminoimidazole ribonucleotide synthase n=1 Tax=Pontibacillus halophilus JSM 076056 = DSM 19796 TaxID=1385510 RepID=A0A0A5GGK2_9BACI|nr:5-(carboxyamino)imidazole ribonucleotide synthase [Pontibacillus halophilus]KGX90245.1 phosphoribosylaminoimidazole carboxylase [Pontibacillus halophilus JSM 076056 = DSM 19796]